MKENKTILTFPREFAEKSNYYLKLDRKSSELKVYKRYDYDINKLFANYYPLDEKFNTSNTIVFELIEQIPCLFGGKKGQQTPRGIYKIQNVSKVHEEFISRFHPIYDAVKFFGYIEIWEYYYIHSNIYKADVDESNFQKHPESKVINHLGDDGIEYTSGCIRILEQEKLDELVRNLTTEDIVDTL